MVIIGYQIEAYRMAQLRYIEKKLYGDGSNLSPDGRRDLANLLNLILSEAVPVEETDSHE